MKRFPVIVSVLCLLLFLLFPGLSVAGTGWYYYGGCGNGCGYYNGWGIAAGIAGGILVGALVANLVTQNAQRSPAPQPAYAYPDSAYYRPVPRQAYAYPDPAYSRRQGQTEPPGEWATVPGQWISGKWVPAHKVWIPVNP